MMNYLKHSTFCAALFVSSVATGCEQKSGAADMPPAQQEAPSAPINPEPAPDTQAAAPTPPAAAANPAAQPSATGTPAPSAPSPASPEQVAELSKPSGGPNGGMYTVQDGTKVDPKTLAGWKTWRALACDRCHGAEQQGLVGPALTVSLHRITKEQFTQTLTNGRPEKGMPPFSTSPMVMENMENLYAYLKGRADAQIQPGRLSAIDANNL
jgi:hypothetical protein